MDLHKVEQKQCAESGSPARPPEPGVRWAQPPGKKKRGVSHLYGSIVDPLLWLTNDMAHPHMAYSEACVFMWRLLMFADRTCESRLQRSSFLTAYTSRL